MPTINYTPLYADHLLKLPDYKILYNDYYVDTILGIGPSIQTSRLYSCQLSRPRTMYILPYISTLQGLVGGVGTLTNQPYTSPFSSAPNTVTPCRLTNLNIQIGGQNIFIEPQQYTYQHYINNLLPELANMNGNSLKSKFFSGQITKSMWEKCYGVYTINLEKVTDEIQDNLMKSFQIQFKNDNLITYDFIIMISYQMELAVNRPSGTLTAPGQ